MTSYKIQSHKLQIFQNVHEMKVSVLGKNFGTANDNKNLTSIPGTQNEN